MSLNYRIEFLREPFFLVFSVNETIISCSSFAPDWDTLMSKFQQVYQDSISLNAQVFRCIKTFSQSRLDQRWVSQRKTFSCKNWWKVTRIQERVRSDHRLTDRFWLMSWRWVKSARQVPSSGSKGQQEDRYWNGLKMTFNFWYVSLLDMSLGLDQPAKKESFSFFAGLVWRVDKPFPALCGFPKQLVWRRQCGVVISIK